MSPERRIGLGLLALALLSPAGLFLPELLQAGAAWGEWGVEELRSMLGYVPAGLQRTADVWRAPLPDYALAGARAAPATERGLVYVLSALAGMAACGGAVYLLGRWLCRKAT
jgi:hypothetical protein